MLIVLTGPFTEMMDRMPQVSVDEAKSHLPDLIDAALRGTEVVIKKDNESAVKLVPISSPKPNPRFGSAKGLITLAEDFDAPLEDFAEYMK